MKSALPDIIARYAPITLDEMTGIKLMNRTDTKFVTNISRLKELLCLAEDSYFVQDIKGERIAPYYTLYFDTPDCLMYQKHETGHTNRQKLRIRSYVSSRLNFLEVKTKNNHGRTKKKRIAIEQFDPSDPDHGITFRRQDKAFEAFDDFLRQHLRYDPETLVEQIENRFDRITLVNKAKTERLTIDTNLRFFNIATGKSHSMSDVVIIELKRDGRVPSPILALLRSLRIKPSGFSKYCIGSALTNSALRQNRFKQRIHRIEKRMNG